MKKYTFTKVECLAFNTQLLLNNVKALLLILLTFIFSSQIFGQAADIDQIRNGPANDPTKFFYSDFNNPSYVNGNAGASTAHYVEGMSISYRSLLTGLAINQQYEYTLEYDTRESSKQAIDYLTHYQRLEPHSPFGHAAEVINPRIYIKNGKEYLIGLSPGTNPNTFTIPAPGTVGTPVPGQPLTSYNNLPAAEKLMTIFNGTISSIVYVSEGSLANAAAKTSIRIRFQALKDSVVLAWGGHIASRLDWGFVNGVPRSAGGISGSSYHMRHLSMRTFPGLVNIPLGNQDRSLSAAAVIPPPLCPIVPSQTVCSGGTFGAFTISNPDAGTTYNWSFGTNTAGATFTGGGTTATGTSVTVVNSGGFTGGTFTLNISAVKNSITISCPGVATGTVEVVVATASASPTTIDITSATPSTTLTADIGASSTDPNNANYTYLWEIVTAGTTGQLTNETSRIATYTAGVGDAGTTIQFKVTATQAADPNSPECSDDETVSVNVNTVGACDVTAQTAVCQGTQTSHTGSPNPIPLNATYTWVLEGYQGSGTTSSTFTTGIHDVSVGINATQSYRIRLNQVYSNSNITATCFEDVEVVPTPSVATVYNAPSCSQKTFTVDVTSPTIGFTYSITQPGNPGNIIAPITPTAQNPAVQFTGLTGGDGFTVTVNTGGPGCTATSSCATNPVPPSNAVVDPLKKDVKKQNDLNKVADNVVETYNLNLPSPTKVKTLPNPYTERVRFNLVSGVSGNATLELHNLLGQKVGTVYQGYIKAGQEISKEYYVPLKDRGTLIYTFRVGDQKISGKLLNKK